MSLAYLLMPRVRRAKLDSLAIFANKFRDINRRVCAESYAIYYYTKLYGADSFARSLIGDDFADILCACHQSYALDTHFPRKMREKLFHAFFSWEQERIVAPSVADAFSNFDWGVIEYLALRPKIDFAYFGKGFHLQFADFSQQDERIKRGLQAYRRAEQVGLEHVEDALSFYKLMPEQFHGDPGSYYKGLELAFA